MRVGYQGGGEAEDDENQDREDAGDVGDQDTRLRWVI